MPDETVVFERQPHEPWVSDVGGALIYHLPVERGFASLLFSFVIDARDLEVLRRDTERYYFLFAVLHARYQMRGDGGAPGTDRHFALILHGTEHEVERLLDLADAESNCGVSNLVRLTMGRDQAVMGKGRWFQEPDRT